MSGLSSISQLLPMGILLFSWIFFMPLCSSFFGMHVALVSGECLSDGRVCLEDEMLLLLQLKSTLKFNADASNKLVSWNQSADCCSWGGVTWDATGHVVALDLSSEFISGGFYSSSSIFSLQYLQSLNLANNTFFSSEIPSGFDKLGNLTYLNLSKAGFSGQIPIEISRLTRLVTIDISSFNDLFGTPTPKLEQPKLRMLVQNLKELRELHLDGVDISAQGKEWCQALSSSVPNLRVLSLSRCFLSGPIDSSLVKLRSLSVVHLNYNNFTAPVPDFLANFSNLTSLSLSFCRLYGTFPENIFQVPALQILDLSNNQLLWGALPEFPQGGSLRTLVLSDTKFSGHMPDSIGKLEMLSWIELARCNFSGPIPSSIANLTRLLYLDLSSNGFTGSIPSFRSSKNLTHINLSRNYFTGQIISHHWESFLNLLNLDLHQNLLHGDLPLSLFSHPSLQKIQLNQNQFSGQLNEFSVVSSFVLEVLDLSSNNLQGSIPLSVFDLRALRVLELSFNNVSGTLELSKFQELGNLTTLSLSHNKLSINVDSFNSSFSKSPHFTTLKLASCNLKRFPDLRNNSKFLGYLDLSQNQIQGEIPHWIWMIGNSFLVHLNLSHNLLVDLQEPFPNLPPYLFTLDLHSNLLRGRIPTPPQFSSYVDYSNNSFISSIPEDIGSYISYVIFFSLSKNNISGIIPESICNATNVQVLDLSDNALSGEIPSCLIENEALAVLNLRRNMFSGTISGNFPGNCILHTLDLNGNLLEGTIPESVANCKELEVFNLGKNRIDDKFPCWLKNMSSLRVLVLRANRFHGPIGCPNSNSTWPMLQIVDLAYNNFSGKLPAKGFLTWKAMMASEDEVQSKLNHIQFKILEFSELYYQDAVTVTSKGQEMELVKVLTLFTSIDFYSNKFEGQIPEEMGNFISLYVLNLSGNGFTGQIPSSMGQLRQLESLDLSRNHLSGKIPTELVSLTFLSVLDLSFNQLVGAIPSGNQFQTFSEASFQVNKGLCGQPLNVNCEEDTPPPTFDYRHSASRMEIKWEYIAPEIGFVTGLGIVIWPLVFCRRWRQCYYKRVDRILSRILHHQDQRASGGRRAHRIRRRRM